MKDSIIVFEDTRFNTINAYWQDSSYMLSTLMRDLDMPVATGENLLVFKDNGNMYKVFWNGEIYEVDVWNNQQNVSFHVGTDILCFNDPTTQTFAVFDKGAFYDIELKRRRRPFLFFLLLFSSFLSLIQFAADIFFSCK